MLNIDHSRIDARVLTVERVHADRDPDGQVFPWRAGYPLAGQTIYYAGALWYIIAVEPRSCPLDDGTIVSLIRCGLLEGDPRDIAAATRGELRPVTWTQEDERALDCAECLRIAEEDGDILPPACEGHGGAPPGPKRG